MYTVMTKHSDAEQVLVKIVRVYSLSRWQIFVIMVMMKDFHTDRVSQTKQQAPSVVWTWLGPIDASSAVENGDIGICSCIYCRDQSVRIIKRSNYSLWFRQQPFFFFLTLLDISSVVCCNSDTYQLSQRTHNRNEATRYMERCDLLH